jgi:hypothetical protein
MPSMWAMRIGAALLPLLGGAILALLTVYQFRRGEFVLHVTSMPRSDAFGFWLGFSLYAGASLFLFTIGALFLFRGGS